MGVSSDLDGLCHDVRERGLTLFLGSAVMAPRQHGKPWLVPKWEDLLRALLRRALLLRLGDTSADEVGFLLTHITGDEGQGRPALFDLYQQAALVKTLLGPPYLHELREQLYKAYRTVSDASPLWLDGYAILKAVVGLSLIPEVTAIVTYNFDDIIETTLGQRLPQRERRGGTQAWSPLQRISRGDELPPLSIYHVHGFLPQSRRLPDRRESDIVLSLDEYLRSISASHSWQDTTQLHFLRTSACLFIGAGMRDVNMLRLLDDARRSMRQGHTWALLPVDHVCSNEDDADDDKHRLCRKLTRLRRSLLAGSGVTVIAAPSKSAVPETIDRVSQILAGERR